MKVLWFSNTAASGAEFLKINDLGGGWLSSLEKALSQKIELNVAFYYPRYMDSFLYKGVRYHPICKNNWKWHFIKTKLFGNFINEEDLNVYLNLISAVKPDIIHIHGTENPFGCIVDNTPIPVVVSIQGNITVYFHKYLSGIEMCFLSVRQYNFKNIYAFPYYHTFGKSYRLFEKMRERELMNLKKTKCIIGRTDWDRRITKVLAPDRVYFHGEEILRESFYLHQWKPTNNAKLIIHTTNGNSPYKGFETLCQTLTILNNLNIDLEWKVAGIAENDLIVKIAKKMLGKNFPQRSLTLLGGLNEYDLLSNLLSADIYVMPSHIENSPNNLCEAMILGMPCIATFAGGTGSLLKDGEEGILIQDGDPWSMAGAILELWNDLDRASFLGRAARKRALARHDKIAIIDNLVSAYQTIIS